MQPLKILALPPKRARFLSRLKDKRKSVIVILLAFLGLAASRWSAPFASQPGAANCAGVWVGEGDKPAVLNLEQNGSRIIGRLILTGEGADVGLPILDLQLLARDQLGFATQAGRQRSVYRLLLDSTDEARLASIDDPTAMQDYIGAAGGNAITRHSPEKRDRWLKQLREPNPPRLIAVLRRVSPTTPIANPKRAGGTTAQPNQGEPHGS